MTADFDTIVITAANAAQAACFRLQAKGFAGILARRILVVSDPGGKRVGTLGSTVNVLKRVKCRGRMLICHCGGFSKRLPAYAASGKVFAPVSRTATGVTTTLFEEIVRNMAKLRLPQDGALVVCGDLAPVFDFSACDFSRSGVTGVAFLDTLARGSRHGVYVSKSPKGLAEVVGFLQKPSPAAAKRAGAVFGGRVAVDTGILWLDAQACAKLAKSKWNEGDLYADFTAELLKGFAPFSVNTVKRCDFFHIGSSRELLKLLGQGKEWVEGCAVERGAMKLAGGNIVTNVPKEYGKEIVLGRGECLLCLPVGKAGWREVRYRIEDDFKTDGKWEQLGLGQLMGSVNYRRLAEYRNAMREKGLPQVVTVERPLRIDLAGGWSDTPPICNELGGCVLNMAVSIADKNPVRVQIRRIRAKEVRVSSVDLGKRGVLRTMAEIRDHSDPHDWQALVKAALTVTDYRFEQGGIAIVMSAEVPKGSGLGTSSILGAAVVEALGRIAGREYSVGELAELTLQLEREMHTGGGWQDQMGALVPGVKLLTSRAGQRQSIRWKRLDAEAETAFRKYLADHALLYFTGQKRMARNVLNGVVEYYRKNPCNIAREIVRRLKADAAKAFAALERSDWKTFTAAVNAYWVNKKALDPGSTNPLVESIIARIAPLIDAVTLCGAGGGGFMLIIACNRRARQKVKEILEKGSPVSSGKFYGLKLCNGVG